MPRRFSGSVETRGGEDQPTKVQAANISAVSRESTRFRRRSAVARGIRPGRGRPPRAGSPRRKLSVRSLSDVRTPLVYPIPRDDAALGAKLFRGFADPTRLAILWALSRGEKRVVDLVSELRTSQPNASGHLACLKECGLVSDRPEGRQVFYRISSPEVLELLAAAERVLSAHGRRVRLCPRYIARGS
jgi:DNA-binding transcriptional ArsR family regulator